jgi:hypothetical protein
MPLFPFVWQYNNQPIDVLAENIAGLVVNTENYLPVSNGTTFVDSFLEVRPVNGPVSPFSIGVFGMYNGNEIGLGVDFLQNYYSIGGPSLVDAQYGASCTANSAVGYAGLSASHPVNPLIQLGVDASQQALDYVGFELTSPPGPSSGKYLKIMVNGTAYRLELLDFVP